ncbi:hypothetical protein [Streptomyces sp. NPDC056132]|uniref:hypothetical protein n=1 Tax=Streptomyces sp. NPDC056132 TaxID=3345722 RepID=UPI0035D5E4CA
MSPFVAAVARRKVGGERVGIELERVLARLRESGDVEGVTLDEGAAFDALGALAVVDPRRVRGEREDGLAVAAE